MPFRKETPEITAPGYADIRKDIDRLAMLVQEVLTDGNCTSTNERHPELTSMKS
jgi:hypothetical protein